MMTPHYNKAVLFFCFEAVLSEFVGRWRKLNLKIEVLLTLNNAHCLGKLFPLFPKNVSIVLGKPRGSFGFAPYVLDCPLVRAYYKKRPSSQIVFLCDRDRIQTCNRLIRSQLLYSVELRDPLTFSNKNNECDRDRIQTCNRLIRSQLLYSVELRGHCSFVLTGAKIRTFFESASILATLFSKNYSMKRELNSCHPSVSPTFQSLLGEL